MSTMGITIGVLFYVFLSVVFIVIFTSICYELSPYSRKDATVALPEWELKTLYTIAGYPPLSLLLFAILAVLLPGLAQLSPDALQTLTWFCAGHLIFSVVGAAGAIYLRKRNRRNTVYFISDLLSGIVYTGCLILLFFGVHH